MTQVSSASLPDRGRLDDALPLAALIVALTALVFAPMGLLALVLGLAALPRTTGAKGVATAAVILGPLAAALNIFACWWVLNPLVERSRLAERELHDMANMRQIGIAMMSYAKANKESYPEKGADWGKRLVSTVLLLEPALHSPRAKPGQESYFFVAGKPHAGESRRAIVYENPELWRMPEGSLRGGAVLFDDGHVEWITGNNYEAMARDLDKERKGP